MAFGVMAVAKCGMLRTFSQKLTASTKLDNADGDASCSCRCSKYASTSALVKGKGVMLKENLVKAQCVNLMIEFALFNTVFWLRLPNSGRRPDKPFFETMSYMSLPLGPPTSSSCKDEIPLLQSSAPTCCEYFSVCKCQFEIYTLMKRTSDAVNPGSAM